MKTIRRRAKDGLLGLCVEMGLNTLELMFEKELEEKTGRKGKHSNERSGYSRAHKTRRVVSGGRKVEVSKPRAGRVDDREPSTLCL